MGYMLKKEDGKDFAQIFAIMEQSFPEDERRPEEEQLELLESVAKIIVNLVKEGNQIVLTHGNGPQVGMINLAMEVSHLEIDSPDMPFAECGAMSQGYIGYHLQQSIQEELIKQ